jgi:very-short-patch-repair endonuclease
VWERQAGIVTRQQARGAGMSDAAIDAQLEAGRWQRVHPAVLATFSGPLSPEAQLWAAVLFAGPHAVLSHETAAELAGLVERPGHQIHVTVPATRRPVARPGMVVHRSRNTADIRHPALEPPRTRIEETVVDLTQTSGDLDLAVGWLIRAVASRRTTPARLLATLTARRRVRWRRELADALSDVADGCHSLLELRYARQVERAHGLPRGERQRRRGATYEDVAYPEFGTSVELDGKVGHVAEHAFRDHRRDNAVVLAGARVLRYGFADVTRRPCAVAGEVAGVLGSAGWPGNPRACGAGCRLPQQRVRKSGP